MLSVKCYIMSIRLGYIHTTHSHFLVEEPTTTTTTTSVARNKSLEEVQSKHAIQSQIGRKDTARQTD